MNLALYFRFVADSDGIEAVDISVTEHSRDQQYHCTPQSKRNSSSSLYWRNRRYSSPALVRYKREERQYWIAEYKNSIFRDQPTLLVLRWLQDIAKRYRWDATAGTETYYWSSQVHLWITSSVALTWKKLYQLSSFSASTLTNMRNWETSKSWTSAVILNHWSNLFEGKSLHWN